MILVEAMDGVFIESIVWDPNKDPSVEYNLVEFIIGPTYNILISKDDIELRTFGISPCLTELPSYSDLSTSNYSTGLISYNWLLKTRNAKLYFTKKSLALTYYYKLMKHFFPDVTKLEIEDTIRYRYF